MGIITHKFPVSKLYLLLVEMLFFVLGRYYICKVKSYEPPPRGGEYAFQSHKALTRLGCRALRATALDFARAGDKAGNNWSQIQLMLF